MDKKYIMTAFSKDRPGIVADLTEVIYENGGNLEDSTMTSMLDEFVIILLFTAKEEIFEKQLSSDCRRLEKEKGITAFVRTVETAARKKEEKFNKKTINVEGVDQAISRQAEDLAGELRARGQEEHDGQPHRQGGAPDSRRDAEPAHVSAGTAAKP